MNELTTLLKQVSNCKICDQQLPLGARPVLQAHPRARLLIAGQAPGRKVHETGIAFDDASGKRLREWLGIDAETFYDPEQVAILPMGFCYPGTGRSGDLPPRQECAEAWRQPFLNQMKNIQMTVVLGQYAQKYHFPKSTTNLTDLVKSWQQHWPQLVPLPHPSPRNNRWLKQNPWFESELLPVLQQRICMILQ